MTRSLSPSDSAEIERLAEAFGRFAVVEGPGYAPLYERLADGIAGDPYLLEFLLAAPPEQRRHTLLSPPSTPWSSSIPTLNSPSGIHR
jgi:hypothetical protein